MQGKRHINWPKWIRNRVHMCVCGWELSTKMKVGRCYLKINRTSLGGIMLECQRKRRKKRTEGIKRLYPISRLYYPMKMWNWVCFVCGRCQFIWSQSQLRLLVHAFLDASHQKDQNDRFWLYGNYLAKTVRAWTCIMLMQRQESIVNMLLSFQLRTPLCG